MMFYDTVIIGSGVSGMSAGIILAKSGRNVLILEQNNKPGGLMQTFVRKSHLFPTGVHKLGSLGPGEILRRYFNFLGVFDRLKLVPMDAQGYERFLFPGSSFTAPGGYPALFKALVETFPREEKAITAYLHAMKNTVGQFRLYRLTPSESDPVHGIDSATSIHSFLMGVGCSKALIRVLTANNLLYGMVPEECPAFIHFLVTDSFLNSSWRVDEDTTPLATAFTDALAAAGGSLRCAARVDRLNCDSNGIKGVRLSTGEEIACKEVVFTGHPQSMIDLCPEQSFRPAFKKRVKRTDNTPGIFGVAARWMDNTCPFALTDVYLHGSDNPGGNHPSIYLSALPGIKDGACSMTALTALSASHTRWLRDLKQKDRSGYVKAKEGLASSMFDVIADKWPQARDKMEVVATYTPLTFQRYTLSPLGTAYGIKKSAETFWKNQLSPVTRVKGLFLAGQSLSVAGVLGTLISSVQACMAMEGMDSLLNTIADHDNGIYNHSRNHLGIASQEQHKGISQ